MNVLVEGIGSMAFGPRIKYLREIGWNLVGIDITGSSFGFYTGIKPCIVPPYSDNNCFKEIEKIILREKINIVFPTVDEGLLGWSRIKEHLYSTYACRVVVSPQNVIETCVDKWKTYEFFMANGIPTPLTSFDKKYDLLKPRTGRGSTGLHLKRNVDPNFSMDGYISQELVKGDEYTIDILCDSNSNPIYIIPRIRIDVESGLSVRGVTVYDEEIICYSKKIINELKPTGIINIQCFKNKDGIKFIEINPRMAGGCSLSFASSDNWFRVIEALLNNKDYEKKPVKYNNYMFRYYDDLIVQESDLIKCMS